MPYRSKIKQYVKENIRLSKEKLKDASEIDEILNSMYTDAAGKKAIVYFHHLINNLSPEEQNAIVSKVLPENEVKKIEKTRKERLKPELLSAVVAIANVNSTKLSKYSYDALVEYCAENGYDISKTLEAHKKSTLLRHLTQSGFIEHADEIIDASIDLLKEEEQLAILDEMEKLTPDFEKSDEEIEKPLYTNEINEMKASLEGTPEEIEEQKELLDYADRWLFSAKPDFASTFAMKLSNAVDHKSTAIIKDVVKEKGLEDQFDFVPTAQLLKDADAEKLKPFVESKPLPLSDKTREGISMLFDIMEEQENHCREVDYSAEQGDKEYGFFDYKEARADLEKAIVDRDMNALKTAVERHKQTISDMQKMEEIAMTHFNPDHSCVGNLDFTRNDTFPVHYMRNHTSSSQISGVFILYTFMKRNNIAKDDFLKDPFGEFEKARLKPLEQMKPIETKTVYSDGKKKDLGNALLSLTNNQVKPPETLEEKFVPLRIMRGAEVFPTCEVDPAVSRSMFLSKAINEAGEEVMKAYKAHKEGYFADQFGYENNKKAHVETVANLLLFDDEHRDYTALLAEPVRDPETFELINPPFDRKAYLKNNAVEPKDVYDRVMHTLYVFDKKGDRFPNSIGIEEVRNGCLRCARDVLEAYPQLANNKACRALRRFVRNPEREFAKCTAKWKRNAEKECKAYAKTLKNAEKAYNRRYASEKDANKRTKMINEHIEELKKAYNDGKIPARFLAERTRQVFAGVNDPIPAMFERDKFPSRREYIRNQCLDGLTKAEEKAVYRTALERAAEEKNVFVRNYAKERLGVAHFEKMSADEVLDKAQVYRFKTEAEAREADLYEHQIYIDQNVPENEKIEQFEVKIEEPEKNTEFVLVGLDDEPIKAPEHNPQQIVRK